MSDLNWSRCKFFEVLPKRDRGAGSSVLSENGCFSNCNGMQAKHTPSDHLWESVQNIFLTASLTVGGGGAPPSWAFVPNCTGPTVRHVQPKCLEHVLSPTVCTDKVERAGAQLSGVSAAQFSKNQKPSKNQGC